MTAIEKRVEHARVLFKQEIEKLADEVREKYVVPACKKYGLRFRSGNGGYAFYGTHEGRDVSIGGWDTGHVCAEAKLYGWNLKRVCAALNTEVDSTSCLGHYVRSVK